MAKLNKEKIETIKRIERLDEEFLDDKLLSRLIDKRKNEYKMKFKCDYFDDYLKYKRRC